MDFQDPPIDFTSLARSLGVASERVEDPATLDAALGRALANDGPNLVEVVVDDRV